MAASAKIALVTGAGTGVGRAVSIALAKAGYNIVLAGRRKEMLDKVAGEVNAVGAQALAVPTDVSKRESICRLVCDGEIELRPAGCPVQQCRDRRAASAARGPALRDLAECRRDESNRHVPVHAGSNQDHEEPVAARRAASSTTARSRRMRRGPFRSPIPRPSMRSRGSPNRLRSIAGNTTSVAGRSISAMPRHR